MKSKLFLLLFATLVLASPVFAQEAAAPARPLITSGLAMAIASGLCALSQGKAVASSAEAIARSRIRAQSELRAKRYRRGSTAPPCHAHASGYSATTRCDQPATLQHFEQFCCKVYAGVQRVADGALSSVYRK